MNKADFGLSGSLSILSLFHPGPVGLGPPGGGGVTSVADGAPSLLAGALEIECRFWLSRGVYVSHRGVTLEVC